MKLIVRSDVIDIRSDTPTEHDDFLVDTNAWYWLQYANASHAVMNAPNYQIHDYPNFLKLAISGNSKLFTSPLCFSELAHNIEDAECKIYADKANKKISLKHFRYDYPNQRARVAALICEIWQDIQDVSIIAPLNLDEKFVGAAVSNFVKYTLDGYDLYMVEQAKSLGITKIITDDADYCSVSGITVFTANQRALAEAKAAGRLLTRP